MPVIVALVVIYLWFSPRLQKQILNSFVVVQNNRVKTAVAIYSLSWVLDTPGIVAGCLDASCRKHLVLVLTVGNLNKRGSTPSQQCIFFSLFFNFFFDNIFIYFLLNLCIYFFLFCFCVHFTILSKIDEHNYAKKKRNKINASWSLWPNPLDKFLSLISKSKSKRFFLIRTKPCFSLLISFSQFCLSQSIHNRRENIWFDPKKIATKGFLTDLGSTWCLLSHIKSPKKSIIGKVIFFKMAATILKKSKITTTKLYLTQFFFLFQCLTTRFHGHKI